MFWAKRANSTLDVDVILLSADLIKDVPYATINRWQRVACEDIVDLPIGQKYCPSDP